MPKRYTTRKYIRMIVTAVCCVALIAIEGLCAFAQQRGAHRETDTSVTGRVSPGSTLNAPFGSDAALAPPIRSLVIPLFDRSAPVMPLSLELTTTPEYFKSIIFQSTGATPYFFMPREMDDIDLAAPWKLQLARENQHRTLYTILGAVQAGGVAYLAYRHIRKHGLK